MDTSIGTYRKSNPFVFWFYVVIHPTSFIATLYVYRNLRYDQLKEALMATVSISLNTSRSAAYFLNVYKLVEMIILLCLLPMWINEANGLWTYFCVFGCILLTSNNFNSNDFLNVEFLLWL